MFSYYEFEAHEKHNDLIHEATAARMLHQAKGCQPTDNLSSRALIWAGNKLVASGRRMRTGAR